MEEENSSDLVTQRMDEWMERRPEKIAGEEIVRGANSAAQFIFWSGGFSSVWRIRGAKTCDYCKALNGRKIRQGQTYFNGGEDFKPRSFRISPMHISGPVSHPPLHQGCDCYIDGRAGEGTPTEVPDEFKPAKNVDELNKNFDKYKLGKPSFAGYPDKDGSLFIGNQLSKHWAETEKRFPNLKQIRDVKKSYQLKDFHLVNKTVLEEVRGVAGEHSTRKLYVKVATKRSRTHALNAIGSSNNYAVGEDLFSLFRHEMGHNVKYNLAVTKGKLKKSIVDAKDKFEQLWTKKFLAKETSYFSKKISKYAAVSEDEAFAECFSAFTSPKYSAGMLPKEIESIFDDLLR